MTRRSRVAVGQVGKPDLRDGLQRLEALTLGIPRKKLGETTWKRPEIARGIQADQCYYLSADKLAADKAARARKSNDVADYPNPDLAVEIDLSDPKVDRSDIDAQLRVPEVRRLDGESLVIEHLQAHGTYNRSTTIL